MIEIKENSIFTGTSKAFPDSNLNYPVGTLYEDIYIVPVKESNGNIKNHLVQSGKFYIRENYMDILVDEESLYDVSDISNPIFLGCDLAKELDLTFFNEGHYDSTKQSNTSKN